MGRAFSLHFGKPSLERTIWTLKNEVRMSIITKYGVEAEGEHCKHVILLGREILSFLLLIYFFCLMKNGEDEISPPPSPAPDGTVRVLVNRTLTSQQKKTKYLAYASKL